MVSKMMRRGFAASALAMAASAASAGAAWADSYVQIFTKHPQSLIQEDDNEDYAYLEEIEVHQYTGFPIGMDAFGNRTGTGLTVEWWEVDSRGDHKINSDCTFSIGVTGDNEWYNPNSVEVYQTTDNGDRVYRFRHRVGCNPSDVNTGNAHLKIYPLNNDVIQSDTSLPILIHSVAVDSGGNRKERNNFLLSRPEDRYGAEMSSLSDECLIEDFAHHYNPDSDTRYDWRFVSAVNANVNPVAEEGDDGADITSSVGGVVIFPERFVNQYGKKWSRVICDSGYHPETGRFYPAGLAAFPIERTTVFSSLPHTRGGSANVDGQGIKGMELRGGSRGEILGREDVLSVLTYNVASIPGTPNNLEKCWIADWAPWTWGGKSGSGLGGHCNANIKNRRKRLEEIAELVRDEQPDVVVFLEVFQDNFSGRTKYRWGSQTARAKLINALDDIYQFEGVGPSGPMDDLTNNPTECPDGELGQLDPDKQVYPDQESNDMDYDRYCKDPRRSGLDSGVLIGMKNTSHRTQMALISDGFDAFGSADGVDKGSAKGSRYFRIRKGTQVYHIFGTHMQSSNANCPARVAQIRDLVRHVHQRVTPEGSKINQNHRVIITGDLNIDPILNNHVRKGGKIADTCRNELEYLIQKLRTITAPNGSPDVDPNIQLAGRVFLSPFSLPFSNDCLLNRKVVKKLDRVKQGGSGDVDKFQCGSTTAPGNKSKTLDHVIWAGEKPAASGSVFARQVADGNEALNDGADLSGHYPMLTVLDYRQQTTDGSLWTWMDYGDTSSRVSVEAYHHAASRDYDRPTLCPYGVPTEYYAGTDNIDFSLTANPNVEPELVCLPHQCYGNISENNDHICNPATHAGPGATRKYCRTQDDQGKNYAAPCIIPAGYQNLGATSGVTATASSYWGSSRGETEYLPKNIFNGEVLFSTDPIAQRHHRSWAAGRGNEAKHWIKVQLPVAQYVKRVRFRNLGGELGVPNHWGAKTYSIFFNDVFGEEQGCSAPDRIDRTRGDANVACSRIFGDADQAATAKLTYGGAVNWPNPDVWHVHEVETPVLTDEIVFFCDEYVGGGCGIAELEIYGGAE